VRNDDAPEASIDNPDRGAGFTFIVAYQNAKGELSHRRLSIKRIEGYGRPDRLFAYCFETAKVKLFRIDRIIEIASIDTGELHEPLPYFEALRLNGGMPMKDGAMLDLLTVLVFIAECDSEFHPFEYDAIESALTSYVLRHGGDEGSVEKALSIAPKLSPDADDFLAAVKRLRAHPDGRSILGLVERSISAVAQADGIICSEEFEWTVRVKTALGAV
jgi:hypothetical protein